MADMQEIRGMVAALLAKLLEVNAAASALSALVVADPDPAPDPVPVVELRVATAGAGTVAVEWSTEDDPAETEVQWDGWMVERDGTDEQQTGRWPSPVLSPTTDRFTFTSLHPDTDYRITLSGLRAGQLVPVASVVAHTERRPVVVAGAHGPRAVAADWVRYEVGGDDFAGFTLNRGIWSPYRDPTSQHGNRQPEQITIADDPSAFGGRALLIRSTQDGRTGGMAHGYNQRYGRWSARIRVVGKDPRCHQVALTWPKAENWSKGGGEIDYCEGAGGGVKKVQFFLHYGPAGPRGTAQTQSEIAVDPTEYHWWEMEWTPGWVEGYCDGVRFFRDTDTSHFTAKEFGAHHGTLQLDLFRNSPADVLGATEMWVDTMRVYRCDASVAA